MSMPELEAESKGDIKCALQSRDRQGAGLATG